MNLTEYSIQRIAKYIIGEKNAEGEVTLSPYRSGSDLVDLFNKYGCTDVYRGGLPKINPGDNQGMSRTVYVVERLSNHPILDRRGLLTEIVNHLEDGHTDHINEILRDSNLSIIKQDGRYIIQGGAVVAPQRIATEVIFRDIENKVLAFLDKAEISIRVAMAWFTNERIKQKLIEKQRQGVSIKLVIFKDHVNARHGVDLTGFDVRYIRGTRGGYMHNKFCIVDLHFFQNGSYNWSDNAEFRNDETITDNENFEEAKKLYTEFRRLYSAGEINAE